MLTKSKLVAYVIFIFLFLSIGLLISYPYISPYISSLLHGKETLKESSVFKQLTDTCDPSEGSQSTSSKCKKDIPTPANVVAKNYYAFLAETTGEDSKVNPAGTSWDWKTNRIMATVIGNDSTSQTLTIYIDSPANAKNLYKVQKNVTISCTPSETAMLSTKDIVFLEGDFNLLDKAQYQDMISTYCMNETCDSIGKECILFRRPQ